MRTKSLMLNSLITREKTGNFNDFGRLGAELWPKKPCLLSGFRRNSLLNGTGNFETSTANYFAGTGNFLQITGNCIEVQSDWAKTARSRRDSFTVRSDGLARASCIFCRTPFGSGFSVATTFQRRNRGMIKFTGQRRSSSTPSSRHIQLKS
jgi:hypothetical protein